MLVIPFPKEADGSNTASTPSGITGLDVSSIIGIDNVLLFTVPSGNSNLKSS